MTGNRFIQRFDLTTAAPEMIPRLRRFIFDLAVRGKLVQQESGGESGESLLGRIKEAMAREVHARGLRPPKDLPTGKDEQPILSMPDGWTWSRLGEVALCLDSIRVPINAEERAKRTEGKDQNELYPYYGATQQQGWIDDFLFDEELVLLGEDGVPFFDDLRPKAYVIDGKSWVNNHAHVFRGIMVSNRFIALWLNVFDYSGRVPRATRSKLNQSKALTIPIPLPPLDEQKRIVAKVDELMALCDALEVAQTKREGRRDRLVAATLHHLTNGADAQTQRRHTGFYLSHLPRLTTRPEHIHSLRQTILDLAVRGKLVTQDPNDEPAEAILEKVRRMRAGADFNGRRRAPKRSQNRPRPLPFTPPESWRVCHIEDISLGMTNGIYKPARFYKEEGVLCLRMYNIRNGQINFDRPQRVVVDNEELDSYLLQPGDLLVNRVNSRELVGKAALIPESQEPLIFESKNIRLRLPKKWLDPGFIILLFQTGFYREIIEGYSKQACGQATISQPQLGALPVPLPSQSEQKRIVAKVDDLMALCDALQASLTTASTTRRRLLEATLHEALAG